LFKLKTSFKEGCLAKKPKFATGSGDQQWKIESLSGAYRYQACRWAVVNAFFPHEKHPDRKADELLETITRRWRALLTRLRCDSFDNECGWKKADSPLDFQYLRNCPPAGFGVTSSSRSCKCSLICPWCWTRQYVLEPYRKLEKVLFGPNGHALKLPCKLLVFRRKPYQDADLATDPNNNLLIFKAIKKFVALVRDADHRHKEVYSTQIRKFGGYVLHKLSCLKGRPVLTRSGVFLIKAGSLPRFDASMGYFVRQYSPTRKTLAMAVALAGRFPSSWFMADSYKLVTYLREFRRVRMLATFGIMRKPIEGVDFSSLYETDYFSKNRS
jgi:hypothetical protein